MLKIKRKEFDNLLKQKIILSTREFLEKIKEKDPRKVVNLYEPNILEAFCGTAAKSNLTPEYLHTHLLAWLLNPAGNHGLGTKFLKSFLKKNNIHIDNLNNVEISTRAVHGTNKPDIKIVIGQPNQGKNAVIYIENKTKEKNAEWKKNGKKQTEIYANIIKKKHQNEKVYCFFLTPSGSKPGSDFFMPFSYNDLFKLVSRVLPHVKNEAIAMVIDHWRSAMYYNILDNYEQRNIAIYLDEIENKPTEEKYLLLLKGLREFDIWQNKKFVSFSELTKFILSNEYNYKLLNKVKDSQLAHEVRRHIIEECELCCKTLLKSLSLKYKVPIKEEYFETFITLKLKNNINTNISISIDTDIYGLHFPSKFTLSLSSWFTNRSSTPDLLSKVEKWIEKNSSKTGIKLEDYYWSMRNAQIYKQFNPGSVLEDGEKFLNDFDKLINYLRNSNWE